MITETNKPLDDSLVKYLLKRILSCYFCGGNTNLLFDLEFDTPVHYSCLKKEPQNSNTEAISFWR